MTEPIFYDLYCRKSQEEEDRQILSLEAQEKECHEFAEKNGIKIRKIWRESFSAKAPGREDFNQMLQDVAAGKIQGILSWHPDRLSRNSVDGGLIIYYLDQGLLKDLAFPTYYFDNNPQGKWMLNIQFGQSKYYVDTLSVNVKRGNRMKIEKGWRTNMAPNGYLNNKADKTIVSDTERFPIIQKAIKEVVYGHSTVMEALDKLNNEYGFRSHKFKKRGGQPMSRSAFYHTLTNPFYYGILLHEGKEHQGKHEPMITIEEFDKLQVILGKKGKPRPQKHEFPLTGQIRCGECNSMITAETKSKYFPQTHNNAVYTYYRCSKKNPSIKCTQKYIRDTELEKQIDYILGGITIPESFHNWALKYLDYMNQHEEKVEETSLKQLHEQHEDARQEMRVLTRLRIREQVDDVTFAEEKKRIEADIKRLEDLLGDANKRADKWADFVAETFDFAYYARMRFAHGELPEKREVFVKIGSNFILKDQKLALELDKDYFGFTEDFVKQIDPLGIDEKRMDKLQEASLVPDDPRWLRGMDSNHDRRSQNPSSCR